MTISDSFFDTPDELVWGMAVGTFSTIIFGWWSLMAGFLCAILWRLGGMYGHSRRVFGVPLVISVMYLSLGLSWFVMFYYVMTACVLSIGYGIQDESDSGSTIGRFWYECFDRTKWFETIPTGKPDLRKVNLYTRGTIAVLLIFSLIPLAMHQDKIKYDKEIQSYEKEERERVYPLQA